MLSAARCLAALGCGEAVGQALQEGSCKWAAESRGAVDLPEPTGSQHGLGRCSTDSCPTEGLLLGPGALQSNPVSICSLQLCVILEPMQELMSRHKTYSLSPRDCLKTCLFQKWQRMVAPPGESHAACCAACGSPGLPSQALPSVQASPNPGALSCEAGGSGSGSRLPSLLASLPAGAERGCRQPALPARGLPAACGKQSRDGNLPCTLFGPLCWGDSEAAEGRRVAMLPRGGCGPCREGGFAEKRLGGTGSFSSGLTMSPSSASGASAAAAQQAPEKEDVGGQHHELRRGETPTTATARRRARPAPLPCPVRYL